MKIFLRYIFIIISFIIFSCDEDTENIGEGYKIAFQQTYYVMTLDEFYPQFDAFMLLPRKEQIDILKD